MKLISIFLIVNITLIFSFKIEPFGRLSFANCGINSIKIDIGSTHPVMVYTARENGKDYKIISIPNELNEKFKNFTLRTSSEVVLEDEKTNSFFYSENKNDTEAIKKLNALNSCKSLHQNIISNKDYEEKGIYAKYRINDEQFFNDLNNKISKEIPNNKLENKEVSAKDIHEKVSNIKIDVNLEKEEK